MAQKENKPKQQSKSSPQIWVIAGIVITITIVSIFLVIATQKKSATNPIMDPVSKPEQTPTPFIDPTALEYNFTAKLSGKLIETDGETIQVELPTGAKTSFTLDPTDQIFTYIEEGRKVLSVSDLKPGQTVSLLEAEDAPYRMIMTN